mmetsp:Transcript_22148/g.58708  ORF Transcript_22148/g.58708 Transcript_22148/m.58708 type:complete len:442 (-) Transcript_22148:248-1573(-)
MDSLREQFDSFLQEPADNEDIAGLEVDSIGDDTIARPRKRKRSQHAFAEELAAPLKGRLRLRPEVPVLQNGKKVDRRDVFDGDSEDDCGEEADLAAMNTSGLALGGLQIDEDMEAEYEKMMAKTEAQLEVMRRPPAEEVASRMEEAKRLQAGTTAFSTLVELRIRLEELLAIGHRMPTGEAHATLCGNAAVAAEVEAVAESNCKLLGELRALQQHLFERHGDHFPGIKGRPLSEPDAWSAVDAWVVPALQRSLGVADTWKDQTQLDVRKSFKVLDQSFTTQMQMHDQVDAAKLSARCTPPPGRHKLFSATETGLGGVENGAVDHVAEAESEIYDDREFYVQLLREVLQGGGSGAGDVLENRAKDLQAEMEGRRAAKKRKQQVDTRASKGRKIRYVPIPKLENFMAPRTRSLTNTVSDAALLMDDAVEVLVRSLFRPGAGEN